MQKKICFYVAIVSIVAVLMPCHQMQAVALNTNGLQIAKSDTSTPKTDLPESSIKRSSARLAVSIGKGFRTTSYSGLTDEQRMSGLAWEAQAIFFINNYIGIGFDHCGYHAKSYSSGLVSNNPIVFGASNTTDMMIYIGPALVARTPLKKWTFDYSLGVGYFGYTIKSSLSTTAAFFNKQTASFNGNTLGIKGGLGINYKLGKHLEIGTSLQLLGGNLKKGTTTTFDGMRSHTTSGNLRQYEELGQFRLMVGLRASL